MRWLMLFFVFSAAICGCATPHRKGSAKAWMEEEGRIKILTTTAQIGDLVQKVGGERIHCLVLIQGDLDPHSYELVKGDDDKVRAADLVFYNGLGLEHGASLSQLLRTEPTAYALGEAIYHAHPEKILWREKAIDPHLWMDVGLWKEGIWVVMEHLVQCDPEGEAYYRERALCAAAEMDRVDRAMQERLQALDPTRRYLVTSHDAFQYFVRAYLAVPGELSWRERLAAPEGLAPEGQLNPVDLQRTLEFLRMHQVQMLFPESNVSPDAIRKIVVSAQEMGLTVHLCREPLYGDSLGGGGRESLSYLDAMERNAEIIAFHLGSEAGVGK